MRKAHPALLLACAAVLVLSPGCGWFVIGSIGAVVAVVTQSGDDGGPVNAAPSAAISKPAANALVSDRVRVEYTLADAEGQACSVAVQYTVNGGFLWQAATEVAAIPSQGTTGLTAPPAGASHVFVWNSFQDLGNLNYPGTGGVHYVRLRLTPSDASGLAGNPATTPEFRLFNGYISTFAGGQNEGVALAFPSGFLVGENLLAGKLYVSDEFQSRVIEIDLATGVAHTKAGTGSGGYTGDNLPGDQAGLTMPAQLAADAEGNLFIADVRANRIRRVDRNSGFITTLAGTGNRGYWGDGGSPAEAELDSPRGLAFDAARGLLYVADTGNHCIRVANLGKQGLAVAGRWVDPGNLATVAGDPLAEWSQDRDGLAGIPGSVGAHASMKADSQGRLHVAYYDETNGNLKYALFRDSRWWVYVVDAEGDVGAYCDLALDASDFPHISYHDADNGALKYTHFDGTTWLRETVDDTGDSGNWTSIVLDSGGLPVIAHTDALNHELRVAGFVSGHWNHQSLDGLGGQYASLASHAASSAVGVAYYLESSGDLRYRVNMAGSGWTTLGAGPDVATTGDVGRFASLAFSSAGLPFIAFHSADNGGDLCLTCWTGTQWLATPITVDQGTNASDDVGTFCSLAIDASDRPHVAYYNATEGSLRYALDIDNDGIFGENVAGVLENREVDRGDSNEPSGLHASITLVSGAPCIAYAAQEQDNGAVLRLRCATYAAALGNFLLSLPDPGTTGTVPSPRALALDESGNLYVATENGVKVLNTGSTVINAAGAAVPAGTIRTIAGNPGSETSLAVDGSGNVHVAYTDLSHGTLRYAAQGGGTWNRGAVPDPGSTDFGASPSVAVDSADTVHLCYYDSQNRTLRYAYKTSGASSTVFPDPGPAGSATGVGKWSCMVLHPTTEQPWIAYYDEANGRLLCTTHSGGLPGTWSPPVVVDDPAATDVGAYPSFAFEPGGLSAGVAYQDLTHQDLKYAHFDGSTWTPVAVDATAEDVGEGTSLAFSAGFPHIAYNSHVRRALKYARFTGTAWQVATLDALGDVGRYPAIAMDQNGWPVVAYSDLTRNRGKILRWTGGGWQRSGFGWNGAAGTCLRIGLRAAPAPDYVFLSFWEPGSRQLSACITDTSSWNMGSMPVERMDNLEQYGGDGRSSRAALFSEINGIALVRRTTHAGAPGNRDALLIADSSNCRIRMVNLLDPGDATAPSITLAGVTVGPGEIDTVIGDGDMTYDPLDDGTVADNVASPVEIGMPSAVAADAQGFLYFADTFAGRIRGLNASGSPVTVCGVSLAAGVVDTVFGGYSTLHTTVYYPSGVAVDGSDGSVYIADYIGYVFRMDPVSRVLTVVAGSGAWGFAGDGGPATAAEFWAPHHVAVDGERNLYIVDRGNSRIRVVNFHNGGAGYAVCGLTLPQGNIQTILGTGVTTGSVDGPGGDASDDLGDDGPCTSATVTELTNIAVDTRNPLDSQSNPRGVLYVSDAQNVRVRAINLNGTAITVAGVTIQPGQIRTVVGTGVPLWSIDGMWGNTLLDDFLPGWAPTSVALARPGPLAVDSRGVLVVFDLERNLLIGVNTSAAAADLAGFTIAPGTVEHLAGDFYDNSRGYNGDGILALAALFEEPQYLAIGPFTDGLNPEVFISDREQDRIRVIGNDGIIRTWAGTGMAGLNGDGVPPENALVNEPGGLAYFASGGRRILYFADSRNMMVRRQVK